MKTSRNRAALASSQGDSESSSESECDREDCSERPKDVVVRFIVEGEDGRDVTNEQDRFREDMKLSSLLLRYDVEACSIFFGLDDTRIGSNSMGQSLRIFREQQRQADERPFGASKGDYILFLKARPPISGSLRKLPRQRNACAPPKKPRSTSAESIVAPTSPSSSSINQAGLNFSSKTKSRCRIPKENIYRHRTTKPSPGWINAEKDERRTPREHVEPFRIHNWGVASRSSRQRMIERNAGSIPVIPQPKQDLDGSPSPINRNFSPHYETSGQTQLL